MSEKKNTVFAGNINSQYDAGMIIKEVHDYFGQSIRTIDTRSVVDSYYTHFRATYNGSDKPTNVKYYRGTTAHKTLFQFASAATLGGKYITLRTAPDNKLNVLWFNLGSDIAPVITADRFMEIPLQFGDTAAMVVAVTAITINTLYSKYFSAQRQVNSLEISTAELGLAGSSTAGTSGFSFSEVLGTQELVAEIDLTYSGSDPVFNGQVLHGYDFDIYSGKFVRSASFSGEITANDPTGKIVPEAFDEIAITAKSSDGPTIIQYRADNIPVATLTITYDIDGDISLIKRT